MFRWIPCFFVAGGLVWLSGCGSAPAPKSFKAELEEAESALASGDAFARNNKSDEALGRYKAAVEIVRKGKLEADGSELSRFKTLESDLREKIRHAEMRKIIAPVAAAPIAKPAAASEDLAAKQQREEAEAKKKADAALAQERKKTEDMLKTSTAAVSSAKKAAAAADDTEDSVADSAKPVAPAKAGDTPAASKTAEAAPEKTSLAPAQPPFAAVHANTPEMEIAKLEARGNFLFAYVQVYNKGVDGGRIDTIPTVVFKDANSNALIQPMSVPSFVYNKHFKADLKDPQEQVYVPVVTAGSQEVGGGGVLRFVAIGASPNAAKCQSVAVKVLLGGKQLFASGNLKAAAAVEGAKPATTGNMGNMGGVNFK